jgi:Holliday junction resolvase RusA-like endonuclease
MTQYTIELPMPPSLNGIWRIVGRRMHESAGYAAWKKKADGYALMQRVGKLAPLGEFEAEIVLHHCGGRRIDLDNGIKVLLDAAQRWEIIGNDRNCRRLTAWWTSDPNEAPAGCRLILRGV